MISRDTNPPLFSYCYYYKIVDVYQYVALMLLTDFYKNLNK